MHLNRSSIALVLFVVSAVVAGALPSVASAQAMYACVGAKSGQMRFVGTEPAACLRGETLVSWSIQGPKGDPGPAGPPADLPTEFSSLQLRVSNLENGDKWRHVSLVVDCQAGESVAAALQKAAPYASAEIGIKGVCGEAVQIVYSNVTMYGVGTGAGLTLPTSSPGPVVEVASTGARLDNLTLTGGSFGLVVDVGTFVQVSNTTVTGSSNHGIIVSGQLALRDSTVTGAGGTGVIAQSGGIVFMDHSFIYGGATDGLLLQASSGFVNNGSIISGNRGGVQLYNGASLDLGAVTISGNRGDGVSVMGGSSVHVNGGTDVTGNVGNGIMLQDTSVITLWGGSSPQTRITDNGGWGVFCSQDQAVAQISGNVAPDVVISGNLFGAIEPRCTAARIY